MKFQTRYSSLFVALVITMCTTFCSYVVMKNYSLTNQIAANSADENEAEQKEANEIADTFLISPPIKSDMHLPLSTKKGLIFNEFTAYSHFNSPETPPPNCFG